MAGELKATKQLEVGTSPLGPFLPRFFQNPALSKPETTES